MIDIFVPSSRNVMRLMEDTNMWILFVSLVKPVPRVAM